jgi:hypothetical protein
VQLALRVIAVCLVVVLAGAPVAGCSRDVAEPPPPVTEPVETTEPDQPAEEPGEEPADLAEPSAIAWLDTELVDVETGETFRMSDFKGTPVLVKSFAVW